MAADPATTRAVGYIRVSTVEQAESGAGLSAQRQAIEAEVTRRSWQLSGVFTDAGVSGKSLTGREALGSALAVMGCGEAEVLIVSKLDRLSRSLLDFASLMAKAKDEGWNLVALDLGIDLSTPAGEFLASVMASAAQWERRIIAQRTRDALAAKRASGTRLGRPRSLPQTVVDLIGAQHLSGATLTGIAYTLNTSGIPTAQGGVRWYPSTVRAVLQSLLTNASKEAAW